MHGRSDPLRARQLHAHLPDPRARRFGHRAHAGAKAHHGPGRDFLLFSIGVGFFYNFVFHTFFGELAAGFIGWEDSPFQAEVGFASLGFAVVGFLAFRHSFDLRLAAVVGPAMFLWGAAGGHVYQMVTAGNFAPGNAGIIFYTDILIPLVGFVFLWLQHRHAQEAAVATPAWR